MAQKPNGKIVKMDVKAGDRVYLESGRNRVKIDSKEYSIMKESDIMGITKSK